MVKRQSTDIESSPSFNPNFEFNLKTPTVNRGTKESGWNNIIKEHSEEDEDEEAQRIDKNRTMPPKRKGKRNPVEQMEDTKQISEIDLEREKL